MKHQNAPNLASTSLTPINDLCIFVGAGISLPPPSSLPLFGPIREAIANALGVSAPDSLWAIAPETLLNFLHMSGVPIAIIIRSLLRSDQPNAVHFALAEALLRGVPVWTTNADELIEAALLQSGSRIPVVVGKKPTSVAPDTRLYKVHGTIALPETLAFRTPDVLDPMSVALQTRLRRSIDGRIVLICGYAGADPDIRPALIDALPFALATKWFEVPSAVENVREKYQQLAALGDFKVIPSTNPSSDFLSELRKHGIGNGIPSTLLNALSNVHMDLPNLQRFNIGSRHFAAAQLYELVGRQNSAIARYRRGLRDGTAAQRLRCFIQLYSAGLYYQKPWAKAARSMIAGAAANRFVPLQGRWLSVHARLLEREGQHELGFVAAMKALDARRRSPDRLLDVCATARKTGRLNTAVELSARALKEARSRRDTQGKTIARALYENAYSLRLSGSYAAALSVISELNNNLDLYGGPNWRAWGLCQRGCILVQSTNRYDEAISNLREAIEWFRSLGDPYKTAAVQANLCTAYRAAGRFGEALNVLDICRKTRASLRYQSVLENEVIIFEEAELHLVHGRYDDARERYRALAFDSELPIHQVLGLLGLATANRMCGRKVHTIKRALAMSSAMGFRFGLAHCLVARAISEESAWEEVRDRIRELQVFDYEVETARFSHRPACDDTLCFPS